MGRRTVYLNPSEIPPHALEILIEKIFRDVAKGYSVTVACSRNSFRWGTKETRDSLLENEIFFEKYYRYLVSRPYTRHMVDKIAYKKYGTDWMDQKLREAESGII